MATQFELEIGNNSLRLTNRKSGRSLIKIGNAPILFENVLMPQIDIFESLLGQLVRELEPVRRLWMLAAIEVATTGPKLSELERLSLKTVLTNQGFVEVTFKRDL